MALNLQNILSGDSKSQFCSNNISVGFWKKISEVYLCPSENQNLGINRIVAKPKKYDFPSTGKDRIKTRYFWQPRACTQLNLWLLNQTCMPDRPFRYFGAAKSGDRQMSCRSETWIDGLWRSKFVHTLEKRISHQQFHFVMFTAARIFPGWTSLIYDPNMKLKKK